MAEKLRRGGPAGETEDQTRGIAYLLSYLYTYYQFNLYTYYLSSYLSGGVETGHVPVGDKARPVSTIS